MEKTELEQYIESQGGYAKMDASRLKYLNEYFKQSDFKQKKDAEDKIKELKQDLKLNLVSTMLKYGYGTGSSEFCKFAREVIDELDD